jgi:unsaturated chondroitin disaccharide hydrolase
LEETPESTENNYSNWRIYWRSKPDYAEGWTNGFFPGCLWSMYELTGDPLIKGQAMLWTERIEGMKNYTWFSDQGFAFLPSFAYGYRIGGPECSGYKDPIITAAVMLYARYNPNVGCIDSCDWGPYIDTFTTIIDTMMSIEILFWAAKNGAPTDLYDVAVAHSYKTMDEFVRPDGSDCQMITFDEITGEPIEYTNCDPCEPWARGQAWGAHGFTIAYRETGDPNFLATAMSQFDYFIDHLPTDMVPPNHFNTAEAKDSSASAIAASGLLELCTLVTDPNDQQRYYNAAEDMLTSLSTSYLDGGYMAGSSDVCLLRQANGTTEGRIYADYYFVEALMRYYGMTEF